jgi:glycogen synthase kinase 3 beta
VVYFGTNRQTGEKIAIKKVFQDKKYKNREHQILKLLKHPNNLVMKESFLTCEGEDEYLNIVMDYYSDNLYQLIKKKEVSPLLAKLYAYQTFRALNYLSLLAIAHRDIKPQNILVDRNKHKLIISDFGSAKQLVKGEPNLAYICSRCYRAPELIFGATDYTTQIDMWSTGCVLVEMVNGNPPFLGDSQVDQLIEIIKALGTPSRVEVEEMNPHYDMKEYNKFPKIKTTPWKNVLLS